MGISYIWAKARKQLSSGLLKLFIACLIPLVFSAQRPAQAQELTFVSVAQIKDQAAYDGFIKSVLPVWKRHGMKVLVRLKIVDALTAPNFPPPTEIAVLTAPDRAHFQSYISDPDYQKISRQRIDAVSHLLVLEGSMIVRDGLKFLAKAPMGTIHITTSPAALDRPSLAARINLAGQVKGAVSPFMKQVKSVKVTPLTFDDNPSVLLPIAEQDQHVFVGEIIR